MATSSITKNFIYTTSEILGHSSVSITLNRYVHPTMAHKAENMNKLSGLF